MLLSQPKSDAEWQAENDARTLAEAYVILGDEERLDAAKKAAEKMAEEQANSLAGLLKVAGKLDNKFEGMKILNKKG